MSSSSTCFKVKKIKNIRHLERTLNSDPIANNKTKRKYHRKFSREKNPQEKFENPWLVQVLPEGHACATTDRCFLLANCCTLLRPEARLHLIYQRKKEDERRKEEKSIFPVLFLPPLLSNESLAKERTRGNSLLSSHLRKDSRGPRTWGWTAPIRNIPYVVRPPLNPDDKRKIGWKQDLPQHHRIKSEIYCAHSSLVQASVTFTACLLSIMLEITLRGRRVSWGDP